MASSWHSEEVVAWTEHDGPGRPPAGPSRRLTTAVAWTLGAVFVGVFSTDTLCPEHRVWVQVLATAAFIGVVGAIVALARGSAGAPLLTMLSAGAGVAIGLIDAAHAPERGRLLAGGFALVVLLTSGLALQALRLSRWDRRTVAAMASDDVPALPVEPPKPSASASASAAPEDRARTRT